MGPPLPPSPPVVQEGPAANTPAGKPQKGRRGRRRAALDRTVARELQRRRRSDTAAEGSAADGGRPPAYTGSEVLTSLPRPKRLKVRENDDALPPQREVEVFKAGILRTCGRLFLWLFGGLRFAFGILWDAVRRRNARQNRAIRLRETFQALGPTFVKLGQQLSVRIDLLPYVYAHELERLLDKVPPIRTELAIAEIERSLGRPLGEVFAAFDPEPIGSASLACVYQAVLSSGERVAVKVRRPGAGEALAADLRALGWILHLLELFLLAPRVTANFIYAVTPSGNSVFV